MIVHVNDPALLPPEPYASPLNYSAAISRIRHGDIVQITSRETLEVFKGSHDSDLLSTARNLARAFPGDLVLAVSPRNQERHFMALYASAQTTDEVHRLRRLFHESAYYLHADFRETLTETPFSETTFFSTTMRVGPPAMELL